MQMWLSSAGLQARRKPRSRYVPGSRLTEFGAFFRQLNSQLVLFASRTFACCTTATCHDVSAKMNTKLPIPIRALHGLECRGRGVGRGASVRGCCALTPSDPLNVLRESTLEPNTHVA